MKKILISPSILNADPSSYESVCKELESSGADWIHCDVMDGKFVPNTALGLSVVQNLHKTIQIPLDVHLMVQDPLSQVENYVEAGAKYLTFHLEAVDDVRKISDAIRRCGAKVGISLKPSTEVETLLPFFDLFDMILIMSVEPGFGGQKFIPQSVEKIKKARRLFPDKLIEVDGGINAETAKCAVQAGADILVAGSFIVTAQDKRKAIEMLKNL